MRRPTFLRPRRRGFTIVELLVAAALTMFVMYILAACFATALESFRQVKAVGDMQAKLRSVTATMRRDLMDEHFDRSYSGKAGGPRLSDQNMTDVQWEPPGEGFFRILQLAGSFTEGFDEEGVPSLRSPFATATDTTGSNSRHILHFTVKRYIRKRDDLFATAITDPTNAVAALTRPLDYVTINPPQFLSQWAEIAYFLVPTNTQANGGLPLYYLVRREQLLISGGMSTLVPTPSVVNAYSGMSQTLPGYWAGGSTQLFNSPTDVSAPCRRLNNNTLPSDPNAIAGAVTTGYQAIAAGLPNQGSDIVLTDVLSFQVKVAYDGYTPAANDEFPFADVPLVQATANPQWGAANVGLFDTWSQAKGFAKDATGQDTTTVLYDYSPHLDTGTGAQRGWNTNGNPESLPQRLRVRALQIRLRVWDAKTQQARQVTLIQDM